MPKAERGTPKDIANRIKAKGLQKLKFYCQMCNKQCRDENGFQCHLTSDSHLNKMRLFSSNTNGMLEDFNGKFLRAYLETLRRRHGTQRVNANHVYQEVIHDRHHVHMNATSWATLTDFVQFLGKTGRCRVDETERGWYVAYVDADPSNLARAEAARRKAEDQELKERWYRQREEAGRRRAAAELDAQADSGGAPTARLADAPATSLTLSATLTTTNGAKKATVKPSKAVMSAFEDGSDDDSDEKGDHISSKEKIQQTISDHGRENDHASGKKRKNLEAVLSTVMQKQQTSSTRPSSKKLKSSTNETEEISRTSSSPKTSSSHGKEKGKSKRSRDKDWLHNGIYVRILSGNTVPEEYHRRKAVVDEVVDKYTAVVEILATGPNANDGGDLLKIDRDDLETVVPAKTGKKCRILRGPHKGRTAELVRLGRDSGDLRLHNPSSNHDRDDDTENKNVVLQDVPFENFAKSE